MTKTVVMMAEFIHAVLNYPFMLNALLVGVLASIACGVVGTYVVTRRITYIAGSVAHCVLGGLGLARYLIVVHGWDFLHPMHGAVIASLIASLTIGWVSLKAKEREDTIIGALWAIGMAIGILFIAKTPGYNQDMMSYLFGNILMVDKAALWFIAVLDIIVVGVSLLFYNNLMLVCFDEEYARIRGVNVDFFYILLLCLTGLTVVILVDVVGIIMVIALLTLPAAIAGNFARRMSRIMAAAVAISICCTILGLGLSFSPDLPAGSTIILLTGLVYIVSTVYKRIRT